MTYVKDEKSLHDIAVADYPDIPYFVFGHSWGSMLARCYAAYYGDRIHRKNKQDVNEESVVQEVMEESPIAIDAQDSETSVEIPEFVQDREESPALLGNTKKSFVQKFLDKLDRLMEE